MAEVNVEKRPEERDREESRGVGSRQDTAISRTNEFGTLPSFWRSPSELFMTNPFTLMRRFSEEWDRAFSSAFRGGAGELGGWSPAVEVTERDGKMIVHADLPGINEKDVKVEVTDDSLIIQGERKREHEEQGKGFYRSERSYGTFYRSIPLPAGTNAGEARATFNNGVLEISIPVPEEKRQRRQIPVQTGFGERKEVKSESSGQKTESKAG